MDQQKYFLTGTITNQHQAPLQGLLVKAFDQDPRTPENPLGQPAYTDEQGKYTITYHDKDFRIGGKESGGADIVVRVYDDKGNELAASDMYRNAGRKVVIDLVVKEKTRDEILLDLRLSHKGGKDLDQLPAATRKVIDTLLNQQLEDWYVEVLGEDRCHIQEVLDTVKIDYQAGKDLSLEDFFEQFIIPEVEKLNLATAEVQALKEIVASKSVGKVKDLLELDTRFKENAAVKQAFRRVQTEAFAKLNGIKAEKLEPLLKADVEWTEVNAATLMPLVDEGTLSEKEKESLLLTADLTRLTGDNLPLIKALKTPRLKALDALAELDHQDWVKIIEDKEVPLPDVEESADTYAENLRRNIEVTFPTPYFLNRVIKKNYREDYKPLKTVQKLLAHNSTIIEKGAVNPQDLDWTGISQRNRTRMERDLVRLVAFTNTYRHLGVTEIVNDPDLDENQKQRQIQHRLDALDQFQRNNPHLTFAKTNFLNEQSFNWRGIDAADRRAIKGQMLAYQRVQTLGNDFHTSQTLLQTGFDSAMAISSMPEARFMTISGLPPETGSMVYEKARDRALGSTHYFEMVRDALFGNFKDLAVSNQSSLVNDLRGIDGFDELFGQQDFCDCDHCRSVLSPAAYFTDLMYFIDEHVSKKLFDPGRLSHPLYLRNRRPDLWDINLTCENTKEEIPYLQYVNQVLEAYLAEATGASDVYEAVIAQAQIATSLPVNLPLEELRLYLSHFGLGLHQVYQTMGLSQAEQRREALRLSPEELAIITTPDAGNVRERFGNQSLSDFPVQAFIQYAGIERDELTELLNTTFFTQLSRVTIELKKDHSDIQQYEEVLKRLTPSRLDLIHRYLRLWKKTAWTIREFDLLLNSLKAAGLINTFGSTDANGDPAMLQLVELAILKDSLRLSAEELAAFVHQLPWLSVKDGQKSLFERLFEVEKIFGVADVAADGSRSYHTSATLLADKTEDTITPLLLAGLGISESDLTLLFEFLGMDTRMDQRLDYAIVSRLYRHTRISRALKWSVEELIATAHVLFSGNEVSTLEQLQQLIAFDDRVKKSPFSIAELSFILNGTETSALSFDSSLENSAAAIWAIQRAPEIQTAPEVLVDEERRAEIAEIQKALLLSHLQQSFPFTVAQLEEEILPNLVTIDIDGAGIRAALTATFTDEQADNPDDFEALTTLKRELERIRLLFNRLELSPEAISFLVAHQEVLGIADLRTLTLADIRLMDVYQKLGGIDIEPEAEHLIQQALVQYQADGAFNDEALATLTARWELPVGQLASMQSSFTFSPVALEAVAFLQALLELGNTLGLEGPNLRKLGASGYDDFVVARDAALSAFTAKYPEEERREEMLEPYFDKVNVLKRDALCDYIIARRDSLHFSDRSDLYNYFLLDVEMSGCFRTSPLVAAISSLQLYIHRCLINLEQSESDAEVKVNPTWIPQEEWEWRKNYRVWEANRKVFLYPENYIDPALREDKTHIFKELEDELLQEKISQESAEAAYKKYLTQFSELTKLRFAGAYYEQDFGDINYVNLGSGVFPSFIIITGLFFESEDSKYYLFARSHTDPYQYYYRTYNHPKSLWGNWVKMEVAIEAAEISAIVHQGKLYVFWTEVQTKEINSIRDGNATAGGAVFKVFTKYCFLKEDGTWSTPQRVYLGYMFAEEEKIFLRSIGEYPNDEATRDRRHDEAFSKFEKRVFRKPYVQENGELTIPFNLYYVWSQNQDIIQVNYRIGNTSASYSQDGETQVSLNTPAVNFSIFDGDFSNATQTVSGRYIRKRGDDIISNEEREFIFHLENPTKCVVRFGDISYALEPVQTTIRLGIEASKHPFSLSKNEVVNISKEEIDKLSETINDSEYVFLRREYYATYIENRSFAHYVENGYESFTSTGKRITQSKAGDAELLIGSGGNQEVVPATTILTDEFTDILYAQGLEQFLSLQTQDLTHTSGQKIDLKGPYGTYYWELFFHIPFLIANHLNANQQFKEAKWWYERIFNPTAEEDPDSERPSDYNWQFTAFRNLDMEKLKDILANDAAIEAYKENPFSPHAIARLRISAYQKAVVMKYIDNLLDWGDHLFTQDTRESIHEATMLYVLAQDILGKKPVKLGACETADEGALTYDGIKDRIAAGSEFLIALENAYWVIKQDHRYHIKPLIASKHLTTSLQHANRIEGPDQLREVAARAQRKRVTDAISLDGFIVNDLDFGMTRPPRNLEHQVSLERVMNYDTLIAGVSAAQERRNQWADIDNISFEDLVRKKPRRIPAMELVKESQLVFCVPHNENLLDYWDRVEDRLFKIRHCMNISGLRRSLALFQPPIDPNLLVRARAAGLSMEDILDLVSGASTLPPYRFEYLLSKAKEFTQSVQRFGDALLSALEKKDTEELLLLRSTHEQNILKLTKDLKRKQIETAKYQYQGSQDALANVDNRINYYRDLLDTGLIAWERTQQTAAKKASDFQLLAGHQRLFSSLLYLIPQLGSPFALKFGGKEMGDSLNGIAGHLDLLASYQQAISASASREAGNQRREQEWEQQLTLAEQEFKQVEKQVLAAEISLQMAEKELEVHEKTLDQAKALHSFYKHKFTNLGLYHFLSSHLSRIYRQAYNIAVDTARLAEQAYQFELNDPSFFIAGDNWEADKAGLLAGSRLSLQLQQMEHAYIQGNERKQEIYQTFSLAFLSPSELIQLRQTGTCIFRIPEIAFEMLYPGQYRRLIKSVRVTMPAIVGPYTNVSAKITLLNGRIEREDGVDLADHPIARNTSISLSGALNDSGTFEFNPRDERYLPFEGGGAISDWRIELPSTIRAFNYDTISDVLLTIGYTAEDGDRQSAEEDLVQEVTDHATNHGLFRLVSLKHEFPNTYHDLLHPATGDSQFVEFDMNPSHFPYFLQDRTLILSEVKAYLKPRREHSITPPASMQINGTPVAWSADEDVEPRPRTGNTNVLKGGTVPLTGSPIRRWNIDAGLNGLNEHELEDVLIFMRYSIS